MGSAKLQDAKIQLTLWLGIKIVLYCQVLGKFSGFYWINDKLNGAKLSQAELLGADSFSVNVPCAQTIDAYGINEKP